MTLKEYILTYSVKDENGEDKIVANIPDYYDKVVSELGDLYKERSLNKQRTVICPLHDDTDPSMGLMNHRFLPKVRLYHCFGCNSTGDIIRFHQRIESKYHSREITEKIACEELALLFNIPINDFKEIDDNDYEAKYVRLSKKIDDNKKRYTQRDFSNEILDIRKKGKIVDLHKLNSASIKIIATEKKLYRD